MRDWNASTALVTLGLLLAAAPAQAEDINPNDLLNMSLEQLSNMEVTSVSKRSEKANEAAAAIYVITQEDIRRSGFTSIPEALRMVPGLNVAQSRSSGWAITSRGFNDSFANKLLVLIDGRTVYTPLFSGVFWDVQDTMLEDIERIEVIRGPGATLWGANAVNGVINIITKKAQDTQGGLVAFSAGNQDTALSRGRYGAKIGDDAYVRFYAKNDQRNELRTLTDTEDSEPWNKTQVGFRSDWKANANRNITLQGDVYRAGESGIINLPNAANSFTTIKDREVATGGNVLGRWNERFSANSDMTLQMYYDNARRSSTVYGSTIQTFDLDMQHVWTPQAGHEIVWGAGWRIVGTETVDKSYIRFGNDQVTDHTFSAFWQDKITLAPDFFVTLGSKFEHNNYTGFELQPSARVSWLLDNNQTLWGSVSRAVHTPDRGTLSDSQLLIAPAGPGGFFARTGNDALESETMVAYEMGYRIQPRQNLSIDTAAFYNDYDNLVLGALGPVIAPLFSPIHGFYGIQSIVPVSMGSARSWGFEASVKWNPVNYWDLTAGYSFLKMDFAEADPLGFNFAGKSPEQQFNVSSTVLLPHNVEFTTSFYYVDELKSINIPDYLRMDARVSWKPLDSLELSLIGQNLLDPVHPEFSSFLYHNASQIPRSVYGNVTWKF